LIHFTPLTAFEFLEIQSRN